MTSDETHGRVYDPTWEWIPLAEVARRMNMTKQRVHQIAHRPDFPIPREDWRKVGTALCVPWPPVEEFLRNRNTVVGKHLTVRRTARQKRNDEA